MDRLTDPNPYDVLGISPHADRRTIKLALGEKQRKNTNQVDRQHALHARNTLFSTEKRLLVDAMTPDFVGATDETCLRAILDQMVRLFDPLDWHDIASLDTIIAHDVQALIEATIRYTIGNIPPPECQAPVITAYDGLDEFIDAWIRS